MCRMRGGFMRAWHAQYEMSSVNRANTKASRCGHMPVTSRFYGGSPIRNRMGGEGERKRVCGREEQKGEKGEGRGKTSWLTKWARLHAALSILTSCFLMSGPTGYILFSVPAVKPVGDSLTQQRGNEKQQPS